MSNTILHKPKNKLVISEVYVFSSKDKDGNEGIMGASMPDGTILPFVFADKVRVESLKDYAKNIAKSTKTKVVLLKFAAREFVETIYDPDEESTSNEQKISSAEDIDIIEGDSFVEKCKEIYAYLGISEIGEEGLCVKFEEGASRTLVAITPQDLEAIKECAKTFPQSTRHRLKLVKFTNRVDIEEGA